MIRILFCITCCGAPPSNRPLRGTASAASASEKLVEQADFKSLLTLDTGEKSKEQSLTNLQIQDINNNEQQQQGATSGNSKGKLLSADYQPLSTAATHDNGDGEDLITASTSTLMQRVAMAEFDSEHLKGYHDRELNFDDERSISIPSSIDIEPFKENPNEPLARAPSPAENFESLIGSQLEAPESQNGGHQSRSDIIGEQPEIKRSTPNIPSTTKIGDYARIEYSPVEDLDSVNTQSRAGSLKSTARQSQQRSSSSLSVTASSSGSVASGHEVSRRAISEDISRRSSQGIESTSISIASQLSNEQLQQNLTNMLETTNSPATMFGTIGLPLGPPFETMASGTAKTSPDTTGAALTANSQDSLSGASLGSSSNPEATSQRAAAATLGLDSDPVGAALVGDSMERSLMEDSAEMMSQISRSQASSTGEKRLPAVAKITETEPSDRDSTMSLTASTTTSGGLTNPTPTPSELSGSGSVKKTKLKAKALFKKLKLGSKKNKGENNKY